MWAMTSSCSLRASSTRSWFFSNMDSLMTPVNKAIIPKLPMITKQMRNMRRPGRPHSKPSCDMYSGKFGEDMSTKSVIMEVRMSWNCACRNWACGSSLSSRPTVRTMTIEQTYKTIDISTVTQKMACTASTKPKASRYNCFRNFTSLNSRMILSSLIIRNKVAVLPLDVCMKIVINRSIKPSEMISKSKEFQTMSAFPHARKCVPWVPAFMSSSLKKTMRKMFSMTSQGKASGKSVSNPMTIALVQIRPAMQAWNEVLSFNDFQKPLVSSSCKAKPSETIRSANLLGVMFLEDMRRFGFGLSPLLVPDSACEPIIC
mmetsp:Transcript_42975/g.135395  ORF Transcript_42975/g.135395 Transcript_42975/m.135395 type:complete len:316 (+) Transcript_42975:1556-2503(+)